MLRIRIFEEVLGIHPDNLQLWTLLFANLKRVLLRSKQNKNT